MKRTLLLLLALPLLIAAACFDVPRALVFGWIGFLWATWHRVSIDWGTVAVSGIAALLFTAGVHGLGRAWRRQALPQEGAPAPAWKARWSLAIVAVVFLLFGAGVCLVGITHQVGWLLTDPEPLYGQALKWRGLSGINLWQIGVGAGNYEDTCGRFPRGGTFKDDGTMLHSWETYLLPFIGWATNEIDLDSAWNAPRNQKYFKGPLPVFINPDFRPPELIDAEGYGLSHYAANSRVLAANKGLSRHDITDGASTTLLVGEVNAHFKPWGHPVNWRDPAAGINRSPHGFGGPPRSGGALFAMADGSVRFISERVSPEVLEALATPAGGEEVDPTVLEPAQ
jgi:hypothetical protein